jgi:hypothetical protein
MKRALKTALWTLAIVVACFPVSFIVTFMLTPLWSWIEATYGIESIGHSGPADWCFWSVYGIFVAVALGAYAVYRRRVSVS